ncbi:hypothetical protein LUZ60_007257 [Juncus effusus]|nr:hypothetical protein LUZ60_007257 [Juncus effusus]
MPSIPRYHQPGPTPPPSSLSNSTSDKWGPYTNSGDFTINMVIILTALIAALGLALAINAVIRYVLCPQRRNSNSDPEKPPAQPRVLKVEIPETVYKAGPDGDVAECPICLSEFVDGDRVRVLPLCGHGFHVSCIERWINGGGSCPTCRARCDVVPKVARSDVADGGEV